MTPRYPGFPWRPTGDDGALARVVDACSFHEAVAQAEDSVFGWAQGAHPCHVYVGKQGGGEQYIDFDRRAAGVSNGNGHVATIESYDGLRPYTDANGNYSEIPTGGIYGDSANTGRWDEGQAERLADIAAWMHLSLGVELVCSQRAGDPGFGGHRLGIEPWRSNQYGSGEVWTRHNGKPCPGDLRMQQIPGIIQRAQVIAAVVQARRATWLPFGRVDVASALARGGRTSRPTGVPNTPDAPVAPITQDGFLMALTDAQQQEIYDTLHELRTKGTAKGQEGFGETMAALLTQMQDVYNLENKNKGDIINSLNGIRGTVINAARAGGSPESIADAVVRALGQS